MTVQDDLTKASGAAVKRINDLETELATTKELLLSAVDERDAALEENALLHDEIARLEARVKELEAQLPKARKPVLGQFFRSGVAGEGGVDNPAVTIAEMERINKDRHWMWRVYPTAVGTDSGDLARIAAAKGRNDPLYISTHLPYDFAAVASGTYDAQIKAYATGVLKPVMDLGLLAAHNIQHEPENDELSKIPDEAQRAARFVAMTKHVMDVMASVGVTPAAIEAQGGLWTWPALTEAYYKDGAKRGLAWLAFPDDQFGPNAPFAADLYNRYGSKNKDRSKTLGEKWQDFTQADGKGMADELFALCAKEGRTAAILETAWHEDPRDPEYQKGREAAQQPKIVQAAKDGILVLYCRSNVDAIFSGTWYQHYRVSSTPETDAAFATLSRDSVWRP
jgi:hypothetical protein